MEYTQKPALFSSLGRKANTGKVCATTDVVFSVGAKRMWVVAKFSEEEGEAENLHLMNSKSDTNFYW